MTAYDFDFFVIGGGSGGVRAARIAASHGAKTAVAESRYWGGTCVNVGCVPKKLMSYASHYAHDFEDARGFGWNIGAEPTHDWQTLIQNKNTEIERLNGIYEKLLGNAGATVINGHAKIIDTHTVDVDGTTYTTDKILIATGGWPNKPDIEGIDLAITSNEVFFLDEMPKRVVISGGGYIAVEFAGIFNGLGAEVTQLYRGELFLRGFDAGIRQALADEMRKQGIDLRFNAPVIDKIEQADSGLLVTLTDGQTIETDCVLFAIGRHPLTDNLGLENVGIETVENGAIKVNDAYQTNVDNIYAVGDIIDRVNLTPVALGQGHALADTLFGNNPRDISHENVAAAVFSNPTIGTVGLSEEDAQAKYGDITVYESKFTPMKHTLSGRDEKTFMKLIVDTATDKVVGCHMMGIDAPEIIQGISIAINAGATKAVFDSTIGIHPTAAEELVTMRSARD